MYQLLKGENEYMHTNLKRFCAVVAIVLVLTSVFVYTYNLRITHAENNDWWNANWKYRRQVTLTSAEIDADLVDFPILVHLSASSGLGTSNVTSIFDQVGSDYNALAFVGESGEQYYFEVERWDDVGEEAWVWVKLDASSTADTTFYLYYDFTQDGSAYHDSTKVWDNHFKAVYHMQDETASTIEDSTGYSNDGTKKGSNEPLEASSYIDQGQHFDGTDDYIGCGSDGSLEIDELTLEAHVNFDTIPAPTEYLGPLGRWDPPGNHRSYTFYIYSQKMRLAVSDDGTWTSGHRAECSDSSTLSATTWYYYAGTYDGAPKIYRDGIDVTSVDWDEIDGSPHSTTRPLTLGCHLSNGSPYRFIDGKLDEVRISDIARSPAWIKATYKSGRDQLLSFGSEEIMPTENAVTLKSPANGTTVTTQTVDFKFVATIFDGTIQNASLHVNETDWSLRHWNTTAVQNKTEQTIRYTFSSEGTYAWNVEVFNSTTDSVLASSNRTITIDLPPSYQNVGSNATTILEDAAILLYGQGYDGLGLDSAWLVTNETGAWKNYTTPKNIWSLGSDMLETLADHVSVVYSNSSGDYIYVFGGYNETGWDQQLKRVYVYNVATDAWSQADTEMPVGGVRYAGIQVGEGIYLFGGRLPGGTALDGTSVYFPGNNTWNTAKSDMPYPAFSHGIYYNLSGDGLIHLWGGYNHISGQLSAHTTYNVTSDTFDTSPADLPAGRQGFAWGVYRGKLYVVAGVQDEGSGYIAKDDVYCYDPSSNSWTSKTPLPIKVGGAMGYTQVGRHMYWIEGWAAGGTLNFYKTVYRYSFEDDDWTQATDGYYPNDGNWICTMGNTIYVTGGRNASGAQNWLQIMEHEPGQVVDLNGAAGAWTWSNFTWQNASISAGTTIQWRIYYKDTYGNIAGTDIQSFTISMPATYTLTISSATGGTTNPPAGSYTYDEDETATVTATPYSNYYFDHWVYNGHTSASNPIIITMSQDYTLTPVFVYSGPSVPEFPLGLALEILFIPVVIYTLWRSKQSARNRKYVKKTKDLCSKHCSR